MRVMRYLTSRGTIGMGFGVLLALAIGVCVAERHSGKSGADAEREANQRRERIQAELESLAGRHAWAGAYYQGDGLGANVSLALSPVGGYVFEWYGCLGLYDRNYGSITEADGKLRLSFAFKNERRGFQGIADEFTVIHWASRTYLVPSDDIVGFCNQVNAGAEPRDTPRGRSLLRCGDETKEVEGRPGVPKAYASYLLDKPIEARIVAVNEATTRPSLAKWSFRDTSVTLDAGRLDHLLVGIELHVVEPEDVVESVRITVIEDRSSRGVMTQTEDDEKPQVGWRLSTLPRWARRMESLKSPELSPSLSSQPASRVTE